MFPRLKLSVVAGIWWDLEEPGFQVLGYHITKYFWLCSSHVSGKPIFFFFFWYQLY